MSLIYVPYVTSLSGGCLTEENWASLGVRAVSCSLQTLLTRPGGRFLNDLASLKAYFGWKATLLLDAQLPPLNASGLHVWCSPHDGGKIEISPYQVLSLLKRLDADFILLSDETSTAWLEKGIEGVEGIVTRKLLMNDPICFKTYTTLSHETGGLFTGKVCTLSNRPKEAVAVDSSGYILTDFPAERALLGKVYSEGGFIDLTLPQMSHQFIPMDKKCGCPTCQLGATRAYLHYLFQSTPLLCQRFLIQHNAYHFNRLMAHTSMPMLEEEQ